MSEKCDEAVLVDTLKIDWMDGACDNAERLQCVVTRYCGLRYSGKQWTGKGYKNSVGTYNCHLQSGIDETKYCI
jgi:hypothetical protein